MAFGWAPEQLGPLTLPKLRFWARLARLKLRSSLL